MTYEVSSSTLAILTEYEPIFADNCKQAGVIQSLAMSVAVIESSMNRYAWNPEPHYKYFWDVKRNAPFRSLTAAEVAAKRPPSDFPCLLGDKDQEWWAQQASWGLMQTMGAVAREHGYKAPFLTALVEPGPSIKYGVLHLKALTGRFHRKFGIEGVIAAYNAGSPVKESSGAFRNQGYVDKVTSVMRQLSK